MRPFLLSLVLLVSFTVGAEQKKPALAQPPSMPFPKGPGHLGSMEDSVPSAKNVDPFRWVCVTVARSEQGIGEVTTTGKLGQDCAEVQKESQMQLGRASAPGGARTFCRKETFSPQCQ